jgi:hypothetical protein
MFEKIQEIINPNYLSSFDYERLNELLKIYTEEEILVAYKTHGYKPILYIEKVLKNKKKVPSWLNKEIINEKLDKESKDIFDDFNSFIEEFRK